MASELTITTGRFSESQPQKLDAGGLAELSSWDASSPDTE